MSPVEIVRYEQDDVYDIIRVVREFVATQPFYARLPFSEGKLEWVLTTNLWNEKFFCDVAKVNGQLIGGLAGMLTGYAICHGVFAEDIFGYVKPSHRGLRVILPLLRSFKAWAEAHEAWDVRVSHTSDASVEGMNTLMQRAGYRWLGSVWVTELRT